MSYFQATGYSYKTLHFIVIRRYILVLWHLNRIRLSRANCSHPHDLSDARLSWNKVFLQPRGPVIVNRGFTAVVKFCDSIIV